MNKIKIMDEILANKIAAGEVVEKCSSIVKELVENSIDAGSNEIIVELEEGGKKLITVKDNGSGMNNEDALLAFQRHATSKIYKNDDLFFIDTLGFRGEALPSIASVSKVILKTNEDKIGTLIEIEGGKLIKNESIALKKGSFISVSKLFYNTPARLKYLRSEQYELANIVSLIERLSLSHANISFTLTNEERAIVKTSGSDNLLKAINEIYGTTVSKNMIEIKSSNDDFDLYGYVCKPEILKSNRNHLIIIINNRIIRNNEINRAVNDAYYTYKPETKFPIVVLKINTDPTLIDVNIHPTKQDIKINKMNELYELIYETIKNALYQNLLIPEVKINMQNEEKEAVINSVIKEQVETYEKMPTQTEFELKNETQENKSVIINPSLKQLVLYPVGLVHGTYIIAENDQGMYLIDQHAAQERINYEKNMKALAASETSITQMLIPFSIELSTSEFLKIKQQTDLLKSMGFDMEEFGINTFLFKAHPTWLKSGFEEESTRKILDLMMSDISSFDRIKFNEKVAITLACKMSIKANMHISCEAQEQLLNDLCMCDNPYNCPHGRPTIIKFTNYDLEKMFKRVMN